MRLIWFSFYTCEDLLRGISCLSGPGHINHVTILIPDRWRQPEAKDFSKLNLFLPNYNNPRGGQHIDEVNATPNSVWPYLLSISGKWRH
jgi:hypothetical protein